MDQGNGRGRVTRGRGRGRQPQQLPKPGAPDNQQQQQPQRPDIPGMPPQQQHQRPNGRGRPQQPPQQPQGAWAKRPGQPQPPQQQQPQRPQQPQQPQQPPQQPQGAWAKRPGQPQPPQQQQPQRPQQPQQPQQPPQQLHGAWATRTTAGAPAAATATVTDLAVAVSHVNISGRGVGARNEQAVVAVGGASSASVARGGSSVRGKGIQARLESELLRTKPNTCVTKQGTTGKPVKCQANFLPLTQTPRWGLYQYRVDFSPEVDESHIRKHLVRQVIFSSKLMKDYLFDGTVMYTTHELRQDKELFADNEGQGERYRITIRKLKDCPRLEFGDYHYLQVFNIIMRKCLGMMGYKLVQRNYFNPSDEIPVNNTDMKLWPGFFTSIRQHESSILLNVDLQFKILRKERVSNILESCKNSSDGKRMFQNAIIGKIVVTSYNNRTYKIDDVDFTQTPMTCKFKKSDGTETNIMDYLKEHYKITVSNPNQPLLVSRAKPREIRGGMSDLIHLVPELCQMTGLTDKQREDFQLMKQLATYTRVCPADRIRKLMEFSNKLSNKPEVMAEIRKWDLDVAKTLVEFTGRVLPAQVCKDGAGNEYNAGPKAEWTRELRARPVFVEGKIQKMAVITPARFKDDTQSFMQMLEKAAGAMKFDIGRYKIFEIARDQASDYLHQIEKILNGVTPEMLFVVIPNNSLDRYSAIKKKCYVDRGVPCQVVLSKNLRHKNAMSIATKIAIQINCKVGGAPWCVKNPLSGLMVVGYDVSRDTANKAKSFSAMVSSLDKDLTRYFSSVVEHKLEEELSDNIATFLIMACQEYRKHNTGQLPTHIIIYRDGVGDGQLPYVYDHEVKSINRKLKELYDADKMKVRLAFVVVSKRINTRIFVNQANPPPGLVVDDVITLPERFDFFIVPQCVNQGTVSPTSYNVIEDTLCIGADKLQQLTYKLCHMYFNWSGTVRVPAPCQYAHKLAFLVSQSLHRPARAELSTLLYYL